MPLSACMRVVRIGGALGAVTLAMSCGSYDAPTAPPALATDSVALTGSIAGDAFPISNASPNQPGKVFVTGFSGPGRESTPDPSGKYGGVGQYFARVVGLAGPYLIRGNASSIYSVAVTSGTANVNALTDLASNVVLLGRLDFFRFGGGGLSNPYLISVTEPRMRAADQLLRRILREDYQFIVHPDTSNIFTTPYSNGASDSMTMTLNALGTSGVDLSTVQALLIQEGKYCQLGSIILTAGRSVTELCAARRTNNPDIDDPTALLYSFATQRGDSLGVTVKADRKSVV